MVTRWDWQVDWHGAKMISRYWWAGRCSSWGWDVSRGTGDEDAGKMVCVRYIQVVKTTLGTELGNWFRLGEGLRKKQEERMTRAFLSLYWFFFLSLLLQRNISDCLQRHLAPTRAWQGCRLSPHWENLPCGSFVMAEEAKAREVKQGNRRNGAPWN